MCPACAISSDFVTQCGLFSQGNGIGKEAKLVSIRETIEATFHSVLAETGAQPSANLENNTVLLESGLDSLGFAILVARLDEELGYDPFSISSEAYYPTTFGEFVAFYEQNKPR
jgi:acyl carrier protein